MSRYNKSNYRGNQAVEYVVKTTSNNSNTEEKSNKAPLSAQSQEFSVSNSSQKQESNPQPKDNRRRNNKKRDDYYDEQDNYDSKYQQKSKNNQRNDQPNNNRNNNQGGNRRNQPSQYNDRNQNKRQQNKGEDYKEEKKRDDDKSESGSDGNTSDNESKLTEDFSKFSRNELAEILKDRFEKNQIECPICYNKIKKDAKIWSCTQCFGPFHLNCIKKWIDKNPINAEQAKIQGRKYYTWFCPKCNYNYSEDIPEYLCFCAKTINPEFDPYNIPHSCGNNCGKKRGKYCVHPCTLTCHPGPCPTCTLPGREISCYCNSAKAKVRCNDEANGFSCQQPCQKMASCGKHPCQSVCHDGPCSTCEEVVDGVCYCGKLKQTRTCGKENFSCQNVCEKVIDCGNHKCKDICHPGNCQECLYTPEKLTTCCCGRMSAASLGFGNRKSCLESIPVCGLPCGKTLVCGHKCKKTCHPYDCAQCKEIVIQTCRCGKSERKIECCKTFTGTDEEKLFLCEKVCKKGKSCKNHKCNRVCCDSVKGNDPEGHHLCIKVCGKPISCGKHTCEDFCHLGDCKPCPIYINYPLQCTCGKTVKHPPLPCGSRPPDCHEKCSRSRECGHQCFMHCHYDPCPPCEDLVEKRCICGKKLMKNIKCYRDANCGIPCETKLECGHKCNLVCHKDECNLERGRTGCGAKCGKLRECLHKCEGLCHPGSQCPPDACKILVKLKCECGNKETMIKCGDKDTAKLPCDKSCANMKRFGNFIKKEENKKPFYPATLVKFAKANLSFIVKVEEALEKMFKEGKDFLEVQLYDKNPSKKNALYVLLSKHYLMDFEFHLHVKSPVVYVKSTLNSRLPLMNLSEYLRQIENGKIKPDVLPFEATLKFFNLTPSDTSDDLEYLLKEFEDEYYIERQEGQYLLHFWKKEVAEIALNKLKKSLTNFAQCALEENISLKAEEEKQNNETVIVEKTEEPENKKEEDKAAFLFLSLNSN